ncbi:unnamed protein product, partial [Dicrocoelium dendriticum]
LPSKPSELPQQLGNKTECALLGFVRHLGVNYDDIREQWPQESLLKVYTFNSVRKSMSTIVKDFEADRPGITVFTKGASEMVLKKCDFILDANGEPQPFTTSQQEEFVRNVIEPMAGAGLRTIGIAYKSYLKPGNIHVQIQRFRAITGRSTVKTPIGVCDHIFYGARLPEHHIQFSSITTKLNRPDTFVYC